MRNIQILGTLIWCLCSLMLVPNQVYSQLQSSNRALEVIVDESSNAYFNINFDKGETLYSICKEFHIATIDAMMLNEIVNPDQISIGQPLRLPLNKEFFSVKKPSEQGYIPVYYVVKKQETLFRISKVYFAQDVKDMIERNELTGFTLSIDEKLLVGYYQIDSAHSKGSKVVASSPVSHEPKSTRPAVTAPGLNKVETETIATSTEYVLIDKNIQDENTITEEVITQVESVQVDKPVVAENSQNNNEVQGVSKERVNSVPSVATYRFKPSIKAKFKKVIGSDKIDHSISDNKYSQINAENQLLTDQEMADSATSADSVQTEIVEEKPVSNLTSRTQKGIAYWDKKGKDYENLMVLHKYAEVNTLIKLTNPVNGLSTFARVVGKIPENAFKKDIDVVLSPAVARKIGAIDSRVQIAMTYQINKP